MEKLKNIIKIIFPGLIIYTIIILIFASFVFLYQLKKILILSFIQFTWPFALGIICIFIFHYYSTINKLKHHDYRKNDLFFQDNLFFNELEKNWKKYNNERNEIIHKQQVRENYFQLWSHEIKTPLTRIKLMLQNSSLVQSDKLNEQIIVIQNQLDSLLSYERLNNFNNDLHFNKVNLKDICNQSIKKLMELAISKNISIYNNIGNLIYLTDERWFEVIFHQLLLNAIKYTGNNGEIVINYQNHVLSITDNGIGILATDLPNVFKAGFIGENSRNNENSSGLGLYLVKQICDILNIQIQIISKINFGTTIKLCLDSQLIE
ncbi:sensor histidine kinase [Ligilactobacillus cholophilus]|uniref:sensor histidine kinase n=1 Tax=Ligilactobacillus cholophilus TaxID=3050131 RepID=UPI0025AED318|nr:HAMP domain-containing sensor histidine kinase [Ligilactobacillus cholophilus]